MAKLLVQNLDKSYIINEGFGKRSRVHALRGLNLEVNEGEFVTVIGPNGCGKSTFLMVVAGTHPFDSGVLLLGDRRVMENIKMVLDARGLTRRNVVKVTKYFTDNRERRSTPEPGADLMIKFTGRFGYARTSETKARPTSKTVQSPNRNTSRNVFIFFSS